MDSEARAISARKVIEESAMDAGGWKKRSQLSRRRVNFWQGCQKMGHEVATHSLGMSFCATTSVQ